MFCHFFKINIVILLWTRYTGTDAGFYVGGGHTFGRRGESLRSTSGRGWYLATQMQDFLLEMGAHFVDEEKV